TALVAEYEDLPDPPDRLSEARGAELYARLVLLESGSPLKGLDAGKGVNSAFWLDRGSHDGKPEHHKYLFKNFDGESTQPGYAPGSGACREVMGKALSDQLQNLTGINFDVPETNLVAIPKSVLPPYNAHPRDPKQDYANFDKDGERMVVGSLQHNVN